MTIPTEQSEPRALASAPLEALADAGSAAARAGRLTDVVEAVAEGARRACAADVVVARLADTDRGDLVAVAVAAATPALAAELQGSRRPAPHPATGEVGLDRAPAEVRAVAARVGARAALVVPVRAGADVVGALELLTTREAVAADEVLAARLAAAQVALAARAFGARNGGARGAVDERALRVAADALAAGADAERATAHLLRLALDVSGAAAALAWSSAGDALELVATAGPAAAEVVAAGAEEASARASRAGGRAVLDTVAGRPTVLLPLGDDGAPLLQLVYAPDAVPTREDVDRLAGFAARAAQAFGVAERHSRTAAELEQTRSLLAVARDANAELSLEHTLEIAMERVTELLETDRLAVYLREEGHLIAAISSSVAGPHVRVANELLALALGPYRARGFVAIDDAANDPRLRGAADAVAESGIEAAVGVPLVAHDEVVGLLAVYPPRAQAPTPREAQLLRALGDQLAVPVQNALLHERATRQEERTEQALRAEQESRKRDRALYAISHSFAEHLTLEKTVEAIVRTVVDVLDVDAAALYMPDPRRDRLLPHALHVARGQPEEALRPILYRPQSLRSDGAADALEGAAPLVLDAERAHALAGSLALLAPFLEKGATAAVVPVRRGTTLLATVTVLTLDPGRPIDRATLEGVTAVATQAALAIHNAQLYQQQKEFADAMQRSLLPQWRPSVEGLEIHGHYTSSAHVEIGGDVYDWLTLEDGRISVVLGDVTGHGVDAAGDMAMAKYVFRSLAREHPEPRDFLARANDVVSSEITAGKFITMLYVVVDPRTGEFACASGGHPAPRLVESDGTITPVQPRGLALGVDTGVEYEEVRGRLEPGAMLVLYTDGVIEARRDGELYGTERLDAVLVRHRARDPRDITGSIVYSAERFSGGDLLDDCAIVLIKRTS